MNEEYFDSYDKIDRYLRNNLDDADYAEFSNALEVVSCADVVESLRQQLNACRQLKQAYIDELADMQNREVMLRDALLEVKTIAECDEYPATTKFIKEALATTEPVK